MRDTKTDTVIKEIKEIYGEITGHSENARVDAFLSFYDDSPSFLSISSEGKMSNYEEFKEACHEYYGALKEQTVTTIAQKFQVIDSTLVIVGWTGNIIARFLNGDIMNMRNYSITSVFRKMDGNWKIIHDHESALPPEIIKKES